MEGRILSPYAQTDINDVMSTDILILGVSVVQWIMIDHAEMNLERIRNRDIQLRVSCELTLEGLAKALEFRDRETEGHSRRVVELSISMAKRLGMDDDDMINIKRGALLHDIGKLAVSDHILLKAGLLDPEERAIIQLHPVHAKEILSTIPFLGPCVDIPFSHHENWDGSGYPSGLKGDDIPLFARIFATIDQWDALKSDRPYRKAWPVC